MAERSKRDDDKPTAAKTTTSADTTDDNEDVIRLDLRRAADFLGITPQRLNRLRQRREIPARRVSLLRWSFRQPDLMAYVEKGAGISATGTTPASAADVAAPPPQKQSSLDAMTKIIMDLEPAPDDAAPRTGLPEAPPIVRMANAIIVTCIEKGASDIHIEPDRQNVRVRMRIDGKMQPLMTIPKHIQAAMIARYKVMADLITHKRNVTQLGNIAVKHAENDYSIRVSCVPSLYGENIVMHVLNNDDSLMGLNKLGFDPAIQASLDQLLFGRTGLLLLTGPPNSGLTTTAAVAMNRVNHVERHICSWEEVPEYRIAGITQAYKKGTKGTSTAEGVQALLRHDPNILFLGDINDQESAQAAVDAALSGVLTIATIPALDAVDALRRLVAFGVDRTLASRALAGVCAQRLVRRLCPHCKIAEEHPIGVLGGFGFRPMDRNETMVQLYRGEGCEYCRNCGYKGRVGLFEVMTFNGELAELLRRNAPDGDLRDAARAEGLVPLREDGLRKILGGVTTVDEVTRALHRVP